MGGERYSYSVVNRQYAPSFANCTPTDQSVVDLANQVCPLLPTSDLVQSCLFDVVCTGNTEAFRGALASAIANCTQTTSSTTCAGDWANCPSYCSLRGTCDNNGTWNCNCFSPYSGVSCSVKQTNSTTTTTSAPRPTSTPTRPTTNSDSNPIYVSLISILVLVISIVIFQSN